MTRPAASRADSAPAGEPADALAGVWDLLDALPRSAGLPSITSTTIDMVAARVKKEPRASRSVLKWWPLNWIVSVAIVTGGLVLGVVAGRATMPESDTRSLEYLPLAQHFDLLKEAGSIQFLEDVAKGHYPPPRRFPFAPHNRPDDRPDGRPSENNASGYRQLDAARAAFQSQPFGSKTTVEVLTQRREAVASLSDADRQSLADAVDAFQKLSLTRRRDMIALASAIGDWPTDRLQPEPLLSAARLWHHWVESRDPAERKTVIDLDREERLEWLDHYARANGQPPREWDRDRKPRRSPPRYDGPGGSSGPSGPGGPPRPDPPPFRPGGQGRPHQNRPGGQDARPSGTPRPENPETPR